MNTSSLCTFRQARDRIICLGNRYFHPDSAGPMVYDILARRSLPENTERIDGGLAGLDLLPFLENVGRVIFVDSVVGFLAKPGIVVIDDPSNALRPELDYGHNAGLAYLLRAARTVLETPMPHISLIGIEGLPTDAICEKAADHCLQLLSCPTVPDRTQHISGS
jgi:hydrogenase maturation protease